MEQLNIYKRFEVTIIDQPLYLDEILFMQVIADRNDYNISVTASGRVVVFDGCENVYEVIRAMADMGLAEDVGLIKEITEYEPNLEIINE